MTKSNDAPRVSASDVHRAIEKALVKNNAHDIARSLVVRRPYLEDSWDESAESDFPRVQTKVIRRNGDAVSWNPAKIEAAVRKAFLSMELDSEPARQIALAISQRVVGEEVQFLRIEDLQDMVQEELMRQGFFKVAETYILYRARRAEVRRALEQASHQPPASDPNQDSLILIKEYDGSTSLWDGSELRKRIDFAKMGLDLCLTPEQIEAELRRSIYAEMSRADLQTTITLNAKTLIEQDADFVKFAARILLTYIYEEVLDWSIQRDGVTALASAHRRAFKRNLARGVEIGRLHPRLLDYDLDRLADAIDPAADLDFDFLGIQTLYYRYLIIDKVAKATGGVLRG
jgi:ribonucleoside-diphosphate reductase alpha chain